MQQQQFVSSAASQDAPMISDQHLASWHILTWQNGSEPSLSIISGGNTRGAKPLPSKTNALKKTNRGRRVSDQPCSCGLRGARQHFGSSVCAALIGWSVSFLLHSFQTVTKPQNTLIFPMICSAPRLLGRRMCAHPAHTAYINHTYCILGFRRPINIYNKKGWIIWILMILHCGELHKISVRISLWLL